MSYVVGTFGATGTSPAVPITGDFVANLWGTFSATTVLEKSHDNGTTWIQASKNADGQAASYTAPAALLGSEPKANTLYRWNCTWASGTVSYGLGQ